MRQNKKVIFLKHPVLSCRNLGKNLCDFTAFVTAFGLRYRSLAKKINKYQTHVKFDSIPAKRFGCIKNTQKM